MAPKKSTSTAQVVEPVVAAPAPVAAAAKPTKATKAAPKAVEPVAAAPVEAAKPKRTRAPKAAEPVAAPVEVIKNAAKPAKTKSGETVSLQKVKRQSKPRDPNATPNPYNEYMSINIARLKAEALKTLPEGQKPDHKMLFKQVAADWKNSKEKVAAEAAKAAKAAKAPAVKA
jgi:hypothetical protein